MNSGDPLRINFKTSIFDEKKKKRSVHRAVWRMFVFPFSAEEKPNDIFLGVGHCTLAGEFLCSLYGFVRQEHRITRVLKCKVSFFHFTFQLLQILRDSAGGFYG